MPFRGSYGARVHKKKAQARPLALIASHTAQPHTDEEAGCHAQAGGHTARRGGQREDSGALGTAAGSRG